jgi:hypothetical protein
MKARTQRRTTAVVGSAADSSSLRVVIRELKEVRTGVREGNRGVGLEGEIGFSPAAWRWNSDLTPTEEFTDGGAERLRSGRPRCHWSNSGR